jgi:hypothetical protein
LDFETLVKEIKNARNKVSKKINLKIKKKKKITTKKEKTLCPKKKRKKENRKSVCYSFSIMETCLLTKFQFLFSNV